MTIQALPILIETTLEQGFLAKNEWLRFSAVSKEMRTALLAIPVLQNYAVFRMLIGKLRFLYGTNPDELAKIEILRATYGEFKGIDCSLRVYRGYLSNAYGDYCLELIKSPIPGHQEEGFEKLEKFQSEHLLGSFTGIPKLVEAFAKKGDEHSFACARRLIRLIANGHQCLHEALSYFGIALAKTSCQKLKEEAISIAAQLPERYAIAIECQLAMSEGKDIVELVKPVLEQRNYRLLPIVQWCLNHVSEMKWELALQIALLSNGADHFFVAVLHIYRHAEQNTSDLNLLALLKYKIVLACKKYHSPDADPDRFLSLCEKREFFADFIITHFDPQNNEMVRWTDTMLDTFHKWDLDDLFDRIFFRCCEKPVNPAWLPYLVCHPDRYLYNYTKLAMKHGVCNVANPFTLISDVHQLLCQNEQIPRKKAIMDTLTHFMLK